MINVALIGYGKMGREIAEDSMLKDIDIKSIIDPGFRQMEKPTLDNLIMKGLTHYEKIDSKSLNNVDVAIDFSTPDSVIKNIEIVAAHGINMVVGTTGWYENLDKSRDIVRKSGIGLIWSSNYSIGVYVWEKALVLTADILSKEGSYDIGIQDIHHSAKKDAPSGTAISAANKLVDNFKSKNRIVTDADKRIEDAGNIHVSSLRVGNIIGYHSTIFDSPYDSIEINHRAKSRKAFSQGVIKAVYFINGRKGFFTMDDMMNLH